MNEESLKKLVRSVEGVLDVLELAAADVIDVCNALKGFLDELQPPKFDRRRILEMLPKKLGELVSISEEGDYFIINMKRLLKAEDFKALVDVVMANLGGKYVSTGGGGYFRVQKKVEAKTA